MNIFAISRQKATEMIASQDLKDVLLIDTYNGAPMNMQKFQYFNPFFTWSSAIFPVPGMYGKMSMSIEAIWQGTKIIHGETDCGQFQSKPYKRPPESERSHLTDFSYEKTAFFYDDMTLNHIEARFLIYVIAYLCLLNDHVPDSLIQEILETKHKNKTILFYDWDDNFDITNISESFSHSAILAAWFRHTLEEDFLEKAKKCLSAKYYSLFSAQFNWLTIRYRSLHGETS